MVRLFMLCEMAMILSCKNQMQEFLGLQWCDEERKQVLQMDREVE